MNAKEELIYHIGDRNVEFVSIAVHKNFRSDPIRIKGTLQEVLPLLDFTYDDGYGRQVLFGYIWYEDGSWSDRGEYDGAEWWQHQAKPQHDIEINCR